MPVWTIWLISGCSNLAGFWTGTCTIPTAEDTVMEVDLDVFTDNGFTLEGEMQVRDWEGTTRTSSQFFGSRTSQYAEMRGRFLTELGYYELLLDVEKQGSSLQGECAFTVPEGVGALLGDAELAR